MAITRMRVRGVYFTKKTAGLLDLGGCTSAGPNRWLVAWWNGIGFGNANASKAWLGAY
jgi:hypothetical protein